MRQPPRSTFRTVLLTILASLLLGVGSASAAGLSASRLGANVTPQTVNGQLIPSNLGSGSSSGLGLMRVELIQGTNGDPLVTLAANAHMHLFPILGLGTSMTPAAAATAMAQYVTSVALRYGPGGTFWSQHPSLPYEPIQHFEIGNEPNLPTYWVQDDTHLHWPDPSSYAQVYEAARAALHQVDPAGIAVVGGLGDAAGGGVDIHQDQQWLAALASGGVDAVGFHPYTFFVQASLMWSDTEQLRQYMDANGMQSAPIEIDEVGACDVLPQDTLNTGCGTSISSANWGTFAANYTEWSLCSSALNVQSMQPEYWGDLPTTDVNAILALASTSGSLTPYGQQYLGEAHTLTTQGCPFTDSSAPVVSGSPLSGQTLTASPGTWTGSPSFTYQWERCDASGACATIPGATASSYQAQLADVGSTLAAVVTAAIGGNSEAAWSAPTSVVGPGSSGGGGGGGGGGSGSGGSGSGGGSGGTTSGGGGSGGTNPPIGGGGSTPPPLPSMLLRIAAVSVHGHTVTVTVRETPGSAHVSVVARKGHRVVHFKVFKHNRGYTSLTLTAKVPAGRWTLSATSAPPQGYATAAATRRVVTVHR